MSPGLGPIEDVTPEVTHDFKVSAHLRIWLEVAFAPHAKYESVSFQLNFLQCLHTGSLENHHHRSFVIVVIYCWTPPFPRSTDRFLLSPKNWLLRFPPHSFFFFRLFYLKQIPAVIFTIR